MRYIQYSLKKQIEDFYTFKSYLESRLPKRAFLEMAQNSYSTTMVTVANMPNPLGDLCHVSEGSTDTGPFYVIVFVENPSEPLIDRSSELTQDGLRLLDDLASVIHYYSDLENFQSVRIEAPRYFLVSEDPISHIHMQVLTCRSSNTDLGYFKRLHSIIEEALSEFALAGLPSDHWVSSHLETARPVVKKPTFSLAIRSYDHLFDQLIHDLVTRFPFSEQSTILAIYDDLKRRQRQGIRSGFNTVYMMRICLLLLDSDSYAHVFESLLTEETTYPDLALAAIRKTNDQRLLASFLQKQQAPKEARRLASIKLEYLTNGISKVISDKDLFRSWEMLLTILDSIREPQDLHLLRSAFVELRDSGQMELAAKTIDLCLCGREAFLSGDLPALSRLRSEVWSYSEDIVYGFERDLNALTQVQSEAPLAFISYKHESPSHQSWVRRLGADLRRNGVNALLDDWEILAGDSISDYMSQGVGKSRFFLLVVSEGVLADLDASGQSPLKLEVQMAAARRYGGEDLKMIALLRSTDSPPTLLRDNLWIDFRTDETYGSALERLLESIFMKSNRPPLLPRQ